MRQTRRRFLSTGITIGAISVAGCLESEEDIEPYEIDKICSGECEPVEAISIDSHSGFGSYTDITIQFTEPVSNIRLTAETYDDDVVIGAKNVEYEDTTAVTVEFNNFKTNDLDDIHVHVHYWD